MFESLTTDLAAQPAGLASMLDQLRAMRPSRDAAVGAELIGLLEELKSAAAAAQARQTVAFVDARCAEQTAAGVPAKQVGRGVAHEVGLAKRCSPHHARKYVGWARTLTRELPNTLRELQCGRTSEWRAMLVARETGWLSRADRAQVDAEMRRGSVSPATGGCNGRPGRWRSDSIRQAPRNAPGTPSPTGTSACAPHRTP